MMGWLRAFHPDDREQAKAAWTQAEAGQPLRINGRIWHEKEKRYRHFQTRATAARDDNGHVIEWLGTSTDVDDIVQLQEEQQVLVAELQHRTRNLMAIVQSVMMRTLRGSSDLKNFRGDYVFDKPGLFTVATYFPNQGERITDNRNTNRAIQPPIDARQAAFI
jgi:two-component system CheB/CheR fusion protein